MLVESLIRGEMYVILRERGVFTGPCRMLKQEYWKQSECVEPQRAHTRTHTHIVLYCIGVEEFVYGVFKVTVQSIEV